MITLLFLAACRPECGKECADSEGGVDTVDPDTGDSHEGDTSLESGDTESGATDTDTGLETGDTNDDTNADLGLATADAKLIGESNAYCGIGPCFEVAFPGDVDADGYGDVLVGSGNVANSRGAAYLVRGPMTGQVDLATANARILAEAETDLAGWAVSAAGDVNADGFADVIVGSPGFGSIGGGGAAFVFFGPFEGELSTTDADARLLGEPDVDYDPYWSPFAGGTVASAGDVNGDGYADVLVGAYKLYSGASMGSAYLVHGPMAGEVDLADADTRVDGDDSHAAYLGYVVGGLGDTDGDGHDDIFVTQIWYTERERLLVYLSPAVERLQAADADARLVDDTENSGLGYEAAGAGDVNADGYDDLLVGVAGDDEVDTSAGAGFLFLGPIAGELDVTDANAKVLGEAWYGGAGHSVSSAGDIDADGFDDVLLGQPYGDGGPGGALLFRGPLSGTHAAADARLVGEGDDLAGWSVAGGGDVDGDDVPDLLVGGPTDDDGGEDAGAAWLVYGATVLGRW